MHKRIFALILLDQVTKLIFWSRDFFVGPVHIHPVKNPGLIFSLDFGLLPNLVLVGAALVFFIYFYFQHRSEFSWLGRWTFVLIFAGALSNIIDRLYLGYVRDFLDIGWNFTFNLADVFVIAALAVMLFEQTRPTVEDY